MARAEKQVERVVPRTTALAKPLARVGDPLVLADGRVIQPRSANEDVTVNQPKASSSTFRPMKKRSLKELPAPVNILNGIACVFLYTVLGVGDREIADALKINTSDVTALRKHSAYGECFDSVVGEFINVNSDLIHARIAAYGQEALTSVATIALHGKQESNKLRAGIDLLDRGGLTKKDNASRQGMSANELRIVVIEGDAKVNVSLNGQPMNHQEDFNGET